MSRGIEWHKIDDFIKAVDRFEEMYVNAVKRVVAETATLIQTQAQALAPVDDGTLRKSIDIKFSDGGLKAEIIVGVFYGVFVEYGVGIYAENGNGRKDGWVYFSEKLNRYVFTMGNRPQPFFRPSFEKGMRYFVQEMNKLG